MAGVGEGGIVADQDVARPKSNALGKNIARGCGLGCGGMILLFVLAIVATHFLTTPAMRAQMKKTADAEYAASQAAKKVKVDVVFKALSDLRQSLPDVGNLSEQKVATACAPVSTSFSGAPYMAVDYGWLQQFTDHGFVPAKPAPNPLPWYRDSDFQNIEAEAVPAEGMPGPDYEALLMNADVVDAVPYIAVFLPLEENLPALSGDGRSFQGGLFHGWVILVDGKTRKPIGQTEFTAASSPKIQTFQIGVRSQMLLGNDLKTAMEKDFNDHFWQAANTSVARICGQEAKAGFASHEPNYVPPAPK